MSERKKRKNYLMQGGVRAMAAWPILLIVFIKMIYMSYQNGMAGMSYYAFAVSIFLLLYSLMGMAVVPIIRKMVYFQINKGSYRNASRIYHVILALNMAMALVVAILLFIFSQQLSQMLFGTVLCSLLFKILGVALVCLVPTFCIRGYLEGLGNPMPGVVADVIAQLTGLFVTILTQPAFSSYGQKVAALVRVKNYTYAYSVCSGAVGIVLGGLIGGLFLLLIKSALGKEFRSRIKNDEIRGTDKVTDIIWNYLVNYFSEILEKQMNIVLCVVVMVLYAGNTGKAETGAGMLYTGVFWLMIPVLILSEQIGRVFSRQLTVIMKRLDYHHARERLAVCLKVLSYSILPYAVFLFCLATPVASVFFDVETEAYVDIVRCGVPLAVIAAYSVLFRYISDGVLKPLSRNLFALVSIVAGILFYFMITKTGISAEKAYIYALMFAWLLHLLMECFVLLKKLRIYNQLIRGVLLPFAASVFMGVILFGMETLLLGKIAAPVLVILCMVAGYLLYNMAIVVLHVFDVHEWSEVPLSKFPVFFSKLF